MDAMKILGSLLGGGSMASRQGGDLLGGLLGGTRGGPGGGLADVPGAPPGGGAPAAGGGGLGDILGSVLGGGSARGGTGAGGTPGGLGDILGGALGGGSRGRGGLGGVLGSVAVAALVKYAASRMAGAGAAAPAAGNLLSGAGPGGDPGLAFAGLDTTGMNHQAELLIEAMINAAKADGRVDATEERAILERLGELDADEVNFVQSKLRGPADAAGFAARVPRDMAREVYATSLLAVELDDRSEALYLRDLAQGLGLDAATCNAIHQEMGAPTLYR